MSEKAQKNWFNDRLAIKTLWNKHAKQYPLAINLTVWYIFGALATILLISQIVSGIWLAMYYTPTTGEAFSSVQHVMRDVPLGWLLRYIHTTGASLFFLVVYVHIYRGIMYGSYRSPREIIWVVGVLIFGLLLLEAGSGYVLPWGQMSYWAGKVMVNIYTAVPWIGAGIVRFVQGDFNLSSVVLHRFYSMHLIALPLLMVVFIVLHIVSLHKVGSNNPDGITIKEKDKKKDTLPFHPYYTVKDTAGIAVFLFVFCWILFFAPNGGGLVIEHVNAEIANPLVTPEHIYPAWYMAPFFAILRAIPGKFLGALFFSLSIIALLVLPWLDRSPAYSMRYKGWWSRSALFFLVVSFVGLTICGMSPLSSANLWYSRVFMVFYFYYFVAMPFYSKHEAHREIPNEIRRKR